MTIVSGFRADDNLFGRAVIYSVLCLVIYWLYIVPSIIITLSVVNNYTWLFTRYCNGNEMMASGLETSSQFITPMLSDDYQAS